MASVKNISEFNISDEYEWFAATPVTGDVTISVYSSEGYVEYPYCDIFISDTASLVCFKKIETPSPNKHNFLVSNGTDSFLIQSLNYENAKDIISGEKSSPYSIYVYLNSINITPEGISDVGVENPDHYYESKPMERCDMESWGPFPFYDVMSGYSFTKMRIVFSLSGVAHILRIDSDDTEVKNQQSRSGNTAARSIRGVFKTINEWGLCTGEPFNNNEQPALKALPFVQGLGIPQTVIDETISGSPDMRVVQYLKNTTVPYGETEENYSVPESLQEYMFSVFRYKTVSSLIKNNIYGILLGIDESIIHAEKLGIETTIYSFLISNGVNPETVNLENPVTIVNSVVDANSEVSKRQFINACEAYLGYQ
jgi:hypothetical protein